MKKILLALILSTIPVSAAMGQKDLDYYFTCIVQVREFANENPRTKNDAVVLASAYDLQKMEKCMLDLSSLFGKAGKIATKAAALARE